MAVFIDATDIGSAWVQAYAALEEAGRAVNVAVSISDPLNEDVGVRRAIEQRLVELRQGGSADFANVQSMHTVSNTIFPIGLYRPGSPGAAQRFMASIATSEALRARSRRRGWGTYSGRLIAYPARDGGTTNQLQAALTTLNGDRNYKDAYEMPIAVPGLDESAPGAVVTARAMLHDDARMDARKRGGPCLAHLSLSSPERHGELSMVALYRAHDYETRAYGNFLGLARLLAFLATESGREVGQLLVVTGHARAIAPARHTLLASARKAAGNITAIETHARALGAPMHDLDLPKATP